MTFRDFPHSPETPTFMIAQEYHDYILRFVEHHKLRDNFLLNRLVLDVDYNKDESRDGFKFTVKALNTVGPIGSCSSEGCENLESYKADYVIICNGHQSSYFVPPIKGLDSFRGF